MAAPGTEAPKLRGDLNTFHLLFGILAYNAPLVALVAFLSLTIGYGNGLGAPVDYLAGAVILGLFASGFLKMAQHIDNPGGFYSYIAAGLGKPAGLGASFLAVVTYYVVLLGGYCLVGVLANSFVHSTLGGPNIDWWVWTAAFQVVVAAFGYFNVEFSAKVLTVFMCCEATLILVYCAVVVARGGAHGLSGSSFTPHHVFSTGLGIGLLFAMLSFSGFEVTAVFRDEVRDPNRTIPRAAYAFIAIIGAGYAFCTWVIIQAIGPAKAVAATAADPTGSVTATVQTYLGHVAVDLVSALLITSGFAGLLAAHNVLGRYLFNLGVDGVLPKRIGSAHERHGSPHQASVVVTVVLAVGFLVSVLTHANPSTLYAQLWGVFGYALQALFILTAVAVMVFMWRVRPADATVWHRVIAPVLALVGLVVTMWLATQNISLLIPGHTADVLTFVALGASVLGGILYAMVLKQSRPETYIHIGRS